MISNHLDPLQITSDLHTWFTISIQQSQSRQSQSRLENHVKEYESLNPWREWRMVKASTATKGS